MPTYDFGLAFIVKLCWRVIPSQFSVIVENCKEKIIIGDLCNPVIDPLKFRDEQYIVPLLKSKNDYLRLLACASLVEQDPSDNQSTIDENIKMLTTNGINVGDAIWLSSIKLRNHYQNVERIKDQIISTRHEILRVKKDPSNCPTGSKPEQWITIKKNELGTYEESLIKAEEKLETSFGDMKAHWPKKGIAKQETDNLIRSIKDGQLSLQLVEFIPSQDNQALILNNAFSSVIKWIGVSSQPILNVCEETFSYSSQRDLQRLENAAKILLLLSKIKRKPIGKLLGNAVGTSVISLENFSYSPYMDVRKPSQWQSATSRLALIHLLAMHVFEITPEDQEDQISEIVPKVVDKVNRLLKVQNTPFNFGASELSKDLKSATTYVISSKNYMATSAKNIAIDSDLPADYRLKVIVANEVLIREHSDLLLKFFKEFGAPPIYVDASYKHFAEWIGLLDICMAHCFKFKAVYVAKDIIQIWEQCCPLYGDKCSDFVEYAQKLYLALSQDGVDRKWLKELDGFEQSYCIKFLNEALDQKLLEF